MIEKYEDQIIFGVFSLFYYLSSFFVYVSVLHS